MHSRGAHYLETQDCSFRLLTSFQTVLILTCFYTCFLWLSRKYSACLLFLEACMFTHKFSVCFFIYKSSACMFTRLNGTYLERGTPTTTPLSTHRTRRTHNTLKFSACTFTQGMSQFSVNPFTRQFLSSKELLNPDKLHSAMAVGHHRTARQPSSLPSELE
jgi:hypothetical protein